MAKGLALCLISFFASGCGLIFVPQVTTIPGGGVHSVIVRDMDTKQPVCNANVTLEIRKWDNWMLPPQGWWEYYGDGERPSVHGEDKGETLAARTAAPGTYGLPSVKKLEWIQIWVPWPPVLGPVIYHTYAGSIVVSADDYGMIVVQDRLTGMDGPLSAPRRLPKNTRHPDVHIRNHILFIELPKADGRKTPALTP